MARRGYIYTYGQWDGAGLGARLPRRKGPRRLGPGSATSSRWSFKCKCLSFPFTDLPATATTLEARAISSWGECNQRDVFEEDLPNVNVSHSWLCIYNHWPGHVLKHKVKFNQVAINKFSSLLKLEDPPAPSSLRRSTGCQRWSLCKGGGSFNMQRISFGGRRDFLWATFSDFLWAPPLLVLSSQTGSTDNREGW